MKISTPHFPLLLLIIILGFASCHHSAPSTERMEHEDEGNEGKDKYDGAGAAMHWEFEHQKDSTGVVHRELLWPAIEYTAQLKEDLRLSTLNKGTLYGWTDRGPNSDVVGPTNGNTRNLGSDVAAGRIRGVMVDKGDATGNTVFVGGVAGGLWKTTNITSNPAGWSVINDEFANLAITGICQDPKRPDTIYFCTGEANYNSDAVQGDGVFKSTDGGANWIQLSATTAALSGGAFNYCTRILCDTLGNVYVGTRTGLKRSLNGGTTWTNITPTGLDPEIADIEISANGRLHVSTGLIFSAGCGYRFADVPTTVTSGSGWTAATVPYSLSSKCRVVLSAAGSTLIALPASNSTYNVPTIYQSTDNGANWAALANTPGFTSGQGWYCLASAINPSNTSQFIVGSLDCYRTTNAGATPWTEVSTWVGGGFSYVHADQQEAIWYDAGVQSRVLMVSDGGVFLSTDGGATFSDRNTGLRIKQFYSCAIHPSTTNYLLAGAQDNGCHQFNNAGTSSTVEITGGDGAFVHIDQDEPQFQYGSYLYNQYRRSTDGGSTWSSVNLSGSLGQFINPTDFDNTANIMYCSNTAGTYRRWTNPHSGNTNAQISITNFNSQDVYAVTVSPFTANRVYFGTSGGRLVRVDNAHSTATGSAGSFLGTLSSNIASITFGGSEDTIIVTASNYSGTQVWYTTNGTAGSPTWVSKDGSLPDMPVRWAFLVPGSGGKRAILATETGAWVTADITAAGPVWLADPLFPNVSTYMMKYRSSDNVIAAATHGRGLWSANVHDLFDIALPINDFVLTGQAQGKDILLNWGYQTARTQVTFAVERSQNGIDFETVGTLPCSTGHHTYSFKDARPASAELFYRIRSYDQYGLTQYTNMLSFGPVASWAIEVSNAFPNPFKGQVSLNVDLSEQTFVRLQLLTLTGTKVMDNGGQSIAAGKQVLSLSLPNIAPGSYVLVAQVGSKQYSFKVVKE